MLNELFARFDRLAHVSDLAFDPRYMYLCYYFYYNAMFQYQTLALKMASFTKNSGGWFRFMSVTLDSNGDQFLWLQNNMRTFIEMFSTTS